MRQLTCVCEVVAKSVHDYSRLGAALLRLCEVLPHLLRHCDLTPAGSNDKWESS